MAGSESANVYFSVCCGGFLPASANVGDLATTVRGCTARAVALGTGHAWLIKPSVRKLAYDQILIDFNLTPAPGLIPPLDGVTPYIDVSPGAPDFIIGYLPVRQSVNYSVVAQGKKETGVITLLPLSIVQAGDVIESVGYTRMVTGEIEAGFRDLADFEPVISQDNEIQQYTNDDLQYYALTFGMRRNVPGGNGANLPIAFTMMTIPRVS